MAPLDVPRALLDGEKVVKWDDVSKSFITQNIVKIKLVGIIYPLTIVNRCENNE